MHVNYYRKKNFLKMRGPQIQLWLFTFRPIASKQLNSLTTIDTLSWLGGAEVTYPLYVRGVPSSIPGNGKRFVCMCIMSLCALEYVTFWRSRPSSKTGVAIFFYLVVCLVVFLLHFHFYKVCINRPRFYTKKNTTCDIML